MAKYKLIVVGADETLTGEYDNVVNGLAQAKIRCEELRKEYCRNYPDTYIECMDYNEDERFPYDDFRCWIKDCFGDTYFKWMRVSDDGSRLYMYLK